MAVTQLVYDTIENYLDKVIDLPSAEITLLAKKIAYYCAMLDAAHDSPMDDPEDQTELVEHFQKTIVDLTEEYQVLVNEAL